MIRYQPRMNMLNSCNEIMITAQVKKSLFRVTFVCDYYLEDEIFQKLACYFLIGKLDV